jgi:hypothetical protein
MQRCEACGADNGVEARFCDRFGPRMGPSATPSAAPAAEIEG